MFRAALMRLSFAVLGTQFLTSAPASAQAGSEPEIMTQLGHSGGPVSAAVTPDRSLVLSGAGAGDRTLKLWDMATGRLVTSLEVRSNVQSIAISPNGRQWMSGYDDGYVDLWDAASARLILTIRAHSKEVMSVLFSPDGSRIVTCGQDKTIKVWKADRGVLEQTIETPVHSVAWMAGGRRLQSRHEDTIRVWDLSPEHLDDDLVYKGDKLSPGGTRVLTEQRRPAPGTVMEPEGVKLWDAKTNKLLHTLDGIGAEFSPDSKSVISNTKERVLKLWDVATGKLVHTFEGGTSTGLVYVDRSWFSSDGHYVLSAGSIVSREKDIKVWETRTGKLVRTFRAFSLPLWSAAFSPDGMRWVSAGQDNVVKLWEAASGRLLHALGGHTYPVYSVAFSADSSRVLSGSVDRTLKLWDAGSGNLLRTLEGHKEAVSAVAISPDGRTALSGSHDMTAKLWDLESGRVLRTLEGHKGVVRSVSFSPDGSKMVSATGNDDYFVFREAKLRLWETATGHLLRAIDHPHAIASVAFSPDGSRLVGVSNSMWKMWDVGTGELILTADSLNGQGPAWSAVFSYDGKSVLSGEWDKTIKLRDAKTGALLRTFKGHVGHVRSVQFLPDGARVLSASADGTMRVWALDTGEEIARFAADPGNDWLTITRAGFFSRSQNGDKLLHVLRGRQVTAISQVHQSLFNPDLVREILAGDPKGEAREAARAVNLAKVLDSGPAPAVVITSHSAGSTSVTDLVTVQARITDKGKGIGRIEWRINGVVAAVAARPPGKGPEYTLSQALALDPGSNKIEVVAYTGNNVLASLPAQTNIEFAGASDTVTRPKLHILSIGINAYRDKGWLPPGTSERVVFSPLGLAVNDARVFAEDMRRAAGSLYAEIKVTHALEEEASRANLEKILATLAADIHSRDTFVFFAAAHGISENGRFYLIPQDYQGGLNALSQRAIGQDHLQTWLSKIKAKKAIVLLDTCESGALIAGHTRSRASSSASEAAVGRLHEATGRPVLTAAASGRPALEGYNGHGVFTWAVLDALRSGDINSNGTIELSELVAHVQNLVPKIAGRLNGTGRAAIAVRGAVEDQQSARFGSRGEDFVLARRLQ